jgi:hypothetical protein
VNSTWMLEGAQPVVEGAPGVGRRLAERDRLRAVIGELVAALARWLDGRSAGPEPSPPPPTDETGLEILRVRRSYNRARQLIMSREATIDKDTHTVYFLVGILLVMLLGTLLSGEQDLPLAVIFAGFALAFGAMGAHLQSRVWQVVLLEAAMEDLARQLAVAAAALTETEAKVALAEAELILDGRLRWALATDKSVQGDDRETGVGRVSRWSRTALGALIETAGIGLIGFYSVVTIVALRDGLFTEALSIGVARCFVGFACLWLGQAIRTWGPGD